MTAAEDLTGEAMQVIEINARSNRWPQCCLAINVKKIAFRSLFVEIERTTFLWSKLVASVTHIYYSGAITFQSYLLLRSQSIASLSHLYCFGASISKSHLLVWS